MFLLDLLAWLLALRPIVVVAPDDDGRGTLETISSAAPIATALVAVVAVVVASKALKASRDSAAQSRRSADNSAKSVDHAEAALRGAVRPVLTLTKFDPSTSEVTNAGPGVALDVSFVMGAAPSEDAEASEWAWFATDLSVPVLASKDSHVVHTVRFGGTARTGFLGTFLWCRDVNGETHWTHRVGSEFVGKATTEIGVGEFPEGARRLLRMLQAAKAAGS